MKVEIEDGKYTYDFNGGNAHVLRYGEPWRDVVGDKFIYCMASEIDELRTANEKLVEHVKVLREAMNKLACLGNGDAYGNSIGNCIAQEALNKTGI